jgi:hypothetical protein
MALFILLLFNLNQTFAFSSQQIKKRGRKELISSKDWINLN